MSEIKEYKCPACGGAMEFDSKSQKMKCPYCDTEISVDEYESLIAKADQVVAADAASDVETEQKKSENYTAHDWNQDEIDNMVVYICQSCGGEITADKNTGATTCPFCGNRVVLKGQFEGALKPDYVIPFKLDKKAAKEAYYKHLTGKAFIPSVFRQEKHIDEIVGLYVPFWVFNIESEANISYDAEKIRVWKSGDTEYTEHKYYKIRRGGTIYFEHVPEDGSVKMDDALMESLEPYDFKDAVPFKSAYLAGYVADRYDVDQDECMKRAKKRIRRSTEDSFRETVNGYYALSTQSSTVNIRDSKTSYAMYPVWILNTTWKGQKYTFAMNGQSGKIVGDLPADEGAFWKYVGTRGILISVILYIIMMVVMFL